MLYWSENLGARLIGGNSTGDDMAILVRTEEGIQEEREQLPGGWAHCMHRNRLAVDPIIQEICCFCGLDLMIEVDYGQMWPRHGEHASWLYDVIYSERRYEECADRPKEE